MSHAKIRGNRHVAPLFVCAILLFSALLPFTSVTALPEASVSGPATVTLTERDSGRQVALQQNQILVVSLRGNPSTGYLWEVQGMDETLLREVGTVEFEADSALLGAPGKMVRRFEVVRPGQTTLAMVYHRPWEKGEPDQVYSVQVQGVGPFTQVSSPSIASAAPTPEPAPVSSAAADASAPQSLPATYNYCNQGGCPSIKNQGICGSCWAFATVGPLEALIKRKDGVEKDLAEQYLVSCNMEGYGCKGGWWAHDYHQWKIPAGEPDAGAVYETNFPYVASDTPCAPPHAHHEKIASWASVDPLTDVPSVAKIKQAIYDYGPVSVAVCVGSVFEHYGGGIFQTNETCSPGAVNHGVVLVGWDDTQGGGVWILRNSWGGTWGEAGYMRITWGTSKVGYGASYVMYGGANTAPSAPGPLMATPASQTRINLAWIDTSTNEDGFRIERSPNGSSGWTPLATVAAGVTTYPDSGLAVGTTYYYRVRAYNAAGNSGYSNVAGATTFRQPMTAIYLPLIVDGGMAGTR